MHTLNATACAVPRMMICLLENFQQEDGSIVIPQVLRPFVGGFNVVSPRPRWTRCWPSCTFCFFIYSFLHEHEKKKNGILLGQFAFNWRKVLCILNCINKRGTGIIYSHFGHLFISPCNWRVNVGDVGCAYILTHIYILRWLWHAQREYRCNLQGEGASQVPILFITKK